MAIAQQIGKAEEFDRAEEFLDKLVPATKENNLDARIAELCWQIIQGKITAQNLRDAF